ISIGGIAREREIIRYVPGVDTELLAHRTRIANHLALAIHLHDAVIAHALREVFVRAPDAHFVHACVRVGARSGGRDRVVGLELDHGPRDDAHGREGLLERLELAPEGRLDALAVLYSVHSALRKDS